MARKPMTKSQIMSHLAEKFEPSRRTATDPDQARELAEGKDVVAKKMMDEQHLKESADLEPKDGAFCVTGTQVAKMRAAKTAKAQTKKS